MVAIMRKASTTGARLSSPNLQSNANSSTSSPHRGGDGVVLVGQLVGKIGLGGSGALVDDLAQLAAAEFLGKAQRQHCQMLRHCQPQIRRHPERRQMGAHQRRNVNKVRQHRE